MWYHSQKSGPHPRLTKTREGISATVQLKINLDLSYQINFFFFYFDAKSLILYLWRFFFLPSSSYFCSIFLLILGNSHTNLAKNIAPLEHVYITRSSRCPGASTWGLLLWQVTAVESEGITFLTALLNMLVSLHWGPPCQSLANHSSGNKEAN